MAKTGYFKAIVPADLTVEIRGTQPFKEKASQTFKRGALVIKNGGYIQEAGAGPATFFGIAAEDAHNGASDGLYECIVWPVTPGSLWKVVFNGNGGTAFAQTDIFGNVGMLKDATTGYWYADTGDVGDQFTIKRLAPTWDVGDSKVEVIGTFDSANIADI